MNLYANLCEADYMTPLIPYFKAGMLVVKEDGKIDFKSHNMAWDTPWIHVKRVKNRYCQLWHKIFFPVYGFIPSGCQECWKVVVQPTKVTDLIKLHELMVRLDLPSKCGMEERPTVNGLYGCYFYNDSLEQGRECYEIVKKAVSDHVSPDINVILKRACTEFEAKHPESDKWSVSEDQKKMEWDLNDIFAMNSPRYRQPDHIIAFIKKRWIDFAYEHRDNSYLELTDGARLYRPYVTYHEDTGNNSRGEGQPREQCAECSENT